MNAAPGSLNIAIIRVLRSAPRFLFCFFPLFRDGISVALVLVSGHAFDSVRFAWIRFVSFGSVPFFFLLEIACCGEFRVLHGFCLFSVNCCVDLM